MNRSILLPAAYLVDRLAGDPEWFPHPVRFIGSAISSGESHIRRPDQSDTFELLSGAGLTIAVVGSSYWLSATVIRSAHRRSRVLGSAVELLLAWTCLAARNLEQEATAVTEALQIGDLPLARTRLARIVGRDTENLDGQRISRAVIETVAESFSDGIIAPLFYMALGGVPLAMAYKAVNTLDSMIGHADQHYFYFGKVAARLDDVANYIPSRLTALAIVIAAGTRSNSALHIWWRDGKKHKSPNAGQPESAMAGALGVRLGGENTYAGESIATPLLGEEFEPAKLHHAKRALRLVITVSVLSAAAAITVRGLRNK